MKQLDKQRIQNLTERLKFEISYLATKEVQAQEKTNVQLLAACLRNVAEMEAVLLTLECNATFREGA